MTEYDDAPGGVDTFTISLPRSSRAALQALVDAGRAANISALIGEAVAPYTSTEQDRARTRQRIADLRAGTPLPPDAVAWAGRPWASTLPPRVPARRDRRTGP